MSTRILGEDSTASEQEVRRGLAGQEGLDFSPVPCWGLPDLSVYSLQLEGLDSRQGRAGQDRAGKELSLL